MKYLGTILAAIVLASVLVLYMCSFQVRYTEVAIVKTWGKPAREAITEPGLCWKWPQPIQSVVKYDKRARILEERPEETRTADGKNVVLTTYTLWKIKDPGTFLTNFPHGVEDGEKKLRTTIKTHIHAMVGRHFFHEFVSTNPADRKLKEIEQEIFARVEEEVRTKSAAETAAAMEDQPTGYGVELVAFGIKKLQLPESVTTAIFESMKSNEEAKAQRYIAEGEARAQDIRAEARAVERRIMAAAQQKVAEIQTEAERVVGNYYREFEDHPELRIFLDKLRTVKEALKARTSIIIDDSTKPFDVFDPAERERVIKAAGE